MKLDAVRRYRAQVEDVVRMELLLARQKLQDAEATCQVLGVQAQATVERDPTARAYENDFRARADCTVCELK